MVPRLNTIVSRSVPSISPYQVRVIMDIKVLIKSNGILDLYRESSGVLRALINDGWIVLKDATDTDSIERVMNNHCVDYLLAKVSPHFRRHPPFLILDSRLENSPFQRSPQWEELADKKEEIIAVTAYHLSGKKDTAKWRWKYHTEDNEGDEPKPISVTGGDVILCNGWLARQCPTPEGKTDLIVVNYARSDHSW
ncbi:hypothetical protein AJ78_01558 [Emergomyces pasteurianus Ep9510]|uniref:Uncharacterized protein n=1 Tax=Emergomyces pasteurianus Ep9510 TaxID=1447872 RepID=A0A1J9PQG4_9EURO|nr:hypothetical protein AJ78_01558 [Emergomyces pasteurianus Ep9510]